MNATSFLFACIIISLLIGLYNMYMASKIMKSVHWILSHVHVVGKNQANDPEYTEIKRIFGIEDEEEEKNQEGEE